jgi:hypothetical protein
MICVISLGAVELSDSLRINGYANFNTLTSDSEATQDAEKYLDTSGGIQARYQVANPISVTTQIYFGENNTNNRNDSFELKAKWFYADYYFGHDLTLRGGLFQFPIFKSAETGTIGYTMTWTETPLEDYGANGYEDFIGAELLQSYFYKDYQFLIQLSYGSSENKLPTNRNNEEVDGQTDSLAGITLKTTAPWWSLNVGYLQATSEVEGNEVDFYMYALEGQVDLDAWAFKVGYMNVQLSDIFPDELKYYGSIEYVYGDFTPYMYYARENLYFLDLGNPRDALADVAKERYSLGLRYELNEYTALKFSYMKKVKTSFHPNGEEKEKENIYKAVLNVLF